MSKYYGSLRSKTIGRMTIVILRHRIHRELHITNVALRIVFVCRISIAKGPVITPNYIIIAPLYQPNGTQVSQEHLHYHVIISTLRMLQRELIADPWSTCPLTLPINAISNSFPLHRSFTTYITHAVKGFPEQIAAVIAERPPSVRPGLSVSLTPPDLAISPCLPRPRAGERRLGPDPGRPR